MRQRMISFLFEHLWNQVSQMRHGGLRVAAMKAGKLASMILAAPFVLLIVITRHWILIRFGALDGTRIFCLTVLPETYLYWKEQIQSPRLTLDYIGCPKTTCNLQLQKMWGRTKLFPYDANFCVFWERACKFWTRDDAHSVRIGHTTLHLLGKIKPHLVFNGGENLRGIKLLEELGIPVGAPWVCIIGRDNKYLNHSLSAKLNAPGGSWEYHSHRNFDIGTFIDAATELTKRGYFVLRMGSVVEQLFTTGNPKIIDYSNHSVRSDFADIYLLANCRFSLGGDSGLNLVPAAFGKPFAFINFTTIAELIGNYDWLPTPFIIKRAWHTIDRRFLSLRETFDFGLGAAGFAEQYSLAGVEMISNTPEEIRECAIEVDERLHSNWYSHPEDDELQHKFWEIFRKCCPPNHDRIIQARVGAAFLRQHRYLLD